MSPSLWLLYFLYWAATARHPKKTISTVQHGHCRLSAMHAGSLPQGGEELIFVTCSSPLPCLAKSPVVFIVWRWPTGEDRSFGFDRTNADLTSLDLVCRTVHFSYLSPRCCRPKDVCVCTMLRCSARSTWTRDCQREVDESREQSFP